MFKQLRSLCALVLFLAGCGNPFNPQPYNQVMDVGPLEFVFCSTSDPKALPMSGHYIYYMVIVRNLDGSSPHLASVYVLYPGNLDPQFKPMDRTPVPPGALIMSYTDIDSGRQLWIGVECNDTGSWQMCPNGDGFFHTDSAVYSETSTDDAVQEKIAEDYWNPGDVIQVMGTNPTTGQAEPIQLVAVKLPDPTVAPESIGPTDQCPAQPTPH